MNLNTFYDQVARRADTDKIQVTAADTRRVLAVSFQLMSKMNATALAELLAKALTTAKKKG